VTRHLFVVSRDQLDLHEYLLREFAADPEVSVVLDRRGSQRADVPAGDDGLKQPDRRKDSEATYRLSTLGYILVPAVVTPAT
jgi:hypothetical protein